jgi:hypothetical protein
MPFERYISNESTLSPRHREILILRTAWLSLATSGRRHRREGRAATTI